LVDGTPVFGCEKLTIVKISDTAFDEGDLGGNFEGTDYNWGYGYGNENGKLEYNITLDTTGMQAGIYSTEFVAKIKDSASIFSKEGSFIINQLNAFSFDVFNPENKNYSSNQVQFSLFTSNTSTMRYYENEKWKTLCRKCNSFVRELSFKDGLHSLIIEASDSYGNSEQKSVNFFVDSVSPRILNTEPGMNQVTNGSSFYIKYTEENLKSIVLFYGDKNKTLSCDSGKNKECVTSADLSEYDGQEIEYWFRVTDVADNTDSSKPITVLVDTTFPVLTVNSPVGSTLYGMVVPFNMSVSEKVTLEFMDNSDANPKWEKICSACDSYGLGKLKTRLFSLGIHNLTIRATDKAGNDNMEMISFNSDGSSECPLNDFFRTSYSSANSGEIVSLNGYSSLTDENIDFFRGNIYQRKGEYFGDGSMHARVTLANGTKVQLNVRFTATELVELDCEKITWRNSARGTYWIYGAGTKEVKYDYMDITYYFSTGKIDVVGAGDVDFEFIGIADNRF